MAMIKAQRVNRVRNSLDDEDELLRRLPEIDMISDDDVRDCTIRTFMDGCPDYFWEKPSSSSGKYHSPDERGLHGNWLHTKRVFAEYESLSYGWLMLDRITDHERECGYSAALIHDMMKYGWPSYQNEHTVKYHDVLGAEVAQHIGDCPTEVVLLVHSHMGFWGEGKLPETDNEILFHSCDNLASKERNDVAVFSPAQEIMREWPDVRAI